MSAIVASETNHTYVDEVVQFVHAGAFKYSGQNQETILKFFNLTLTNSYGNKENALLELKNAAFVEIESSYIGDSTEFDFDRALMSFEDFITTTDFVKEPVRLVWRQYVDLDGELEGFDYFELGN